jgi:hypothetical protein
VAGTHDMMIYPFFETMNTFLKTAFILTTLLCCLMHGAAAEEAMLFQIGYLPNMKYRETSKLITKNTITYSGSEEVLDDLFLEGYFQGQQSETYVQTGIVIKTGSPSKQEGFPLKGEIVYYTNSAMPAMKLDGAQFFGRFHETNFFTLENAVFPFDEEGGAGVDLQELQSTFGSQFTASFLMQIGDSAKVTRRQQLPFPGVDIDIDLHVTYKLVGLSSGVAYLKVSQEMYYDGPFEEGFLYLKLSSDGYMLYLPEFKYFSKTEMNVVSEVTFCVEDLNITINQSTITRQNADWWENNEDF